MKKICFIVFFLTEIFFTANSQDSNNLKNKKTMEKINIKNIKDKFSTYKQYVKDGKICESKQIRTFPPEYKDLTDNIMDYSDVANYPIPVVSIWKKQGEIIKKHKLIRPEA
jgi:hypothetical protein